MLPDACHVRCHPLLLCSPCHGLLLLDGRKRHCWRTAICRVSVASALLSQCGLACIRAPSKHGIVHEVCASECLPGMSFAKKQLSPDGCVCYDVPQHLTGMCCTSSDHSKAGRFQRFKLFLDSASVELRMIDLLLTRDALRHAYQSRHTCPGTLPDGFCMLPILMSTSHSHLVSISIRVAAAPPYFCDVVSTPVGVIASRQVFCAFDLDLRAAPLVTLPAASRPRTRWRHSTYPAQ